MSGEAARVVVDHRQDQHVPRRASRPPSRRVASTPHEAASGGPSAPRRASSSANSHGLDAIGRFAGHVDAGGPRAACAGPFGRGGGRPRRDAEAAGHRHGSPRRRQTSGGGFRGKSRGDPRPVRRAAPTSRRAAQLRRALPHRCEPDPGRRVPDRDPHPVVDSTATSPWVRLPSAYTRRRRAGVPHRVGQRLLSDPERGHLDRGRQAVGRAAAVTVISVAPSARVDRATDRTGQPGLVQRRRSQAVDQTAYVERRPPGPDRWPPRPASAARSGVVAGAVPQRRCSERMTTPDICGPSPSCMSRRSERRSSSRAVTSRLAGLLEVARHPQGERRVAMAPPPTDQRAQVGPAEPAGAPGRAAASRPAHVLAVQDPGPGRAAGEPDGCSPARRCGTTSPDPHGHLRGDVRQLEARPRPDATPVLEAPSTG